MIRRALSILIAQGDRHELRALPSGRQRFINGNDLDEAIEIAVNLSDEQVYYSLNPLDATAKTCNKKNVVQRRWLLIDIDSTRPKDTSATEEEKCKASEVSSAILNFLIEEHWPEPLMIDSGNGWHLIYRIDLPNNTLSQQIIRTAIGALGDRFDTQAATVDRKVHDASRISKLPGTLARKGPNTLDRPHRLAKIVFEPSELKLVTAEQLQGLVGKPESAVVNGMKLTASNGTGKTSYVQAAIRGECGRISLSIPGNRNDALNKAAFALGTMADWPEMSEVEARAALLQCALQVGLTDREVLLTITSGWIAGKAEPRKREDPVAAILGSTPEGPTRLTIRASEIVPKRVGWLAPNRIAIGFITIFAGRTGIGKSFVLCDYIARLTTGRALPDAQNGVAPFNVLMISEDPYEYVLAPRLKEMGADLDRVSFLTWEAMASYTLSDVKMLDRAYEEADQPLLIAIDPPTNFLGGKTDEHKNSEVRQILMGIVAWINSKGVACVMITHVNKQVGKGIEAIDRIMGSVAWASTSRIALGFAVDPNNQAQCLFAGIKNNLGPKAPTLAYEIKTTDTLATVEWHGEVDTTANEAFQSVKNKSVAESAAEWLEDRFREKRVWWSKEIIDLGKQSGFSYNAIAKDIPDNIKHSIKKKNNFDEDGKSTGFTWTAAPGWPPIKSPESTESAESVDVSPCDKTTVDTFGSVYPQPKVPKEGTFGSGGTFGFCDKVPKVRKDDTQQGVTEQLSVLSDDSDRGYGPELISAIRWLSGMLGRDPVPRNQFHELGNKLLIDSSTLDQAAEVLRVERTFEDGVEMWSLR